MSSALQVSSGALLMLFALLDVFFTVLYARAGTGVFSPFVCGWEWRLSRRVAKLFGRREQLFLTFCGPAIVASLISWWALLLTIGAALIFHPYLGSAIVTSDGHTPTDFVSATYAAANSMAIVGAGGFSPQTSTFRLIFMFNSLVGMSVISLTLTYLMQIYNALQQRNSLGLHLFMLSGRTGSGAEMLVRIAPQGHLESGFSTLSDLASAFSQLKEMHHFYPVLLYFRFQEAHYSVSFMTSTVLDCISLIESAIDPKENEWLQTSGAVDELWSVSILLLDMIQKVFSPAKRGGPQEGAIDAKVEQWRRDYRQSFELFQHSGIQTTPDAEEGASKYIELRREWAQKINTLAQSMSYPAEEVNPNHANEGGSGRVLSFRTRSSASPYQLFRSKEK